MLRPPLLLPRLLLHELLIAYCQLPVACCLKPAGWCLLIYCRRLLPVACCHQPVDRCLLLGAACGMFAAANCLLLVTAAELYGCHHLRSRLQPAACCLPPGADCRLPLPEKMSLPSLQILMLGLPDSSLPLLSLAVADVC